MPATRNRELLIPPPAPDYMRAFMSFGTDGLHRAKRTVDGKEITANAEKGAAKRAAEELGFKFY